MIWEEVKCGYDQIYLNITKKKLDKSPRETRIKPTGGILVLYLLNSKRNLNYCFVLIIGMFFLKIAFIFLSN